MEELTLQEAEAISGGNPILAGIGFALGAVGAFNSLTEFGAGLGIGIYDATH